MLDDTNLLGKIVTFVVIGLLGWLAFTTQQMSLSQVQQGEQIKSIQSTLQAQQLDRYTRSEAIANNSLLERRVKELEEEADGLRERLRILERYIDQQQR